MFPAVQPIVGGVRRPAARAVPVDFFENLIEGPDKGLPGFEAHNPKQRTAPCAAGRRAARSRRTPAGLAYPHKR